MAVIERTFAIDEKVAQQLDEIVDHKGQSQFINELIVKFVYESNKKELLEKMDLLKQSIKKPNGISTTKMIYRLRNGGD